MCCRWTLSRWKLSFSENNVYGLIMRGLLTKSSELEVDFTLWKILCLWVRMNENMTLLSSGT